MVTPIRHVGRQYRLYGHAHHEVVMVAGTRQFNATDYDATLSKMIATTTSSPTLSAARGRLSFIALQRFGAIRRVPDCAFFLREFPIPGKANNSIVTNSLPQGG